MFKIFKRITCNHDWELISFKIWNGEVSKRTDFLKVCKKCELVKEGFLADWALTEEELNKYIK